MKRIIACVLFVVITFGIGHTRTRTYCDFCNTEENVRGSITIEIQNSSSYFYNGTYIIYALCDPCTRAVKLIIDNLKSKNTEEVK